jgi:tetratricopeptide (TPR) repeat protein
MSVAVRFVFMVALASALPACATVPAAPPVPAAPRYPDVPVPEPPPGVGSAAVRAHHDVAWRRLQSGDLRGAIREYEAAIAADPDFYPALTGLGHVRLIESNFGAAAESFARATARNGDYLPAWRGQVRAQLGLGRDEEAISAIERVLALDPGDAELSRQLDLLRFRRLQSLIDSGRQARAAGRLPEAIAAFERALVLSPTSAVLHRELGEAEAAAGRLEQAEAHARRALELDPNDAESYAVLGAVLEAQGRDREAGDAYGRAVAIDPRPEWRQSADRLTTRADLVVIPPEFRAVPTADSVTRAQVAAFIGIRLEGALSRAPGQTTEVATDVRGHWAASWILPVTRAGVMEIFPNHTFQPATIVRRGDLARIVVQLLELDPLRRMDLLRWQTLRPEFADLPASNLFYTAAAVAVSSGAMAARNGNRFLATEPATGPDLVAAIERVEQISGR